jgi:hypothetical protein
MRCPYARWFLLSLLPLALCGCGQVLSFPAQPVAAAAGPSVRAYDTQGAGRADFFLFADTDGRISRIGFDRSGRGSADDIVDLDAIPFQRCRHLVIILDGFGYDVVKAYYDAGGLRMFHAPSRVIAPYPTLTDTSLEDVFNYIPCAGYEAQYFDRQANQVVGGAGSYLTGADEPYARFFRYRASILWDAISYVQPWAVFRKEINDALKGFERGGCQEFIAYFVSSAGVGTQDGAVGQKRCLERTERMINQVLWRTHGMVKITLTADHGHSYTPSTLAPMAKYLEKKGWRLRDHLNGERDVVWIRFGLVTYASLDTRRPAALAADLAGCPGVDLVSFTDGAAVTVLDSAGGRATIRRKGDAYSYELAAGDPLTLRPILSALKADAEGYYDANAVFTATADHEYPAPLERLWRGHFGLVQHPTSVLASLKDNYYSGSSSFAGAVHVASTHGSLNRKNSTTFIMSTAGELPPLLRSGEVHTAMSKLVGGPWPMER